jgi:hypothetical protein
VSAAFGNLEIFKFLHENGCTLDTQNTCRFAAIAGKLDIFLFIFIYFYFIVFLFFLNGKLDILKYARENGCEWDERTCANAASEGHLDCLKYVFLFIPFKFLLNFLYFYFFVVCNNLF